MTEVLFYHLTEKTLEQTLPGLLEKSLERDWNVVVQIGSKERLEALDTHLWSYRDDSFLAHSSSLEKTGASTHDGFEGEHPIWLTLEHENPNKAQIRFMVDGATPDNLDEYERAVYIFDGHDEAALAHARERWKIEKAADHDITYWQQKPNGSWEKKATEKKSAEKKT